MVAGCSALDSPSSSTVPVAESTIRNRIDREIDQSVPLVDDGDVAYWQSVSVPAEPNPFVSLESLPSEAGVYELCAHVSESDEHQPVHADLTEDAGDQSCVTVGMEVTTVTDDRADVPAVVYGTLGRW